MKVLAITQARYSSTRLLAKILKEVNGKTLLEIHLSRILKSNLITKLKVATTTEQESDYIVDIAEKLGVESYKGSLDDVLDRFYRAAKSENPDYIVRLTSDCPLIDPVIIDRVIDACISSGVDYASNTLNPTYPDGVDVEVFKFSALEQAWNRASLKSEREHVTPYIWKNSSFLGEDMFSSMNVESEVDYSDERITVDTIEDFQLIENLIINLGINKTFTEYIEYLSEYKQIRDINQKYSRNEGYDVSLSSQ